MLTEGQLTKVAKQIEGDLFQAHRGAIPSDKGRSVIVFGNEGYSTDERVRTAVEKARAALAADGYVLGPVGLDPEEGYTWVFEAVPPGKMRKEVAAERCASEVWKGWAASRDLPPAAAEGNIQRSIAWGVTAGRVLKVAA